MIVKVYFEFYKSKFYRGKFAFQSTYELVGDYSPGCSGYYMQIRSQPLIILSCWIFEFKGMRFAIVPDHDEAGRLIFYLHNSFYFL